MHHELDLTPTAPEQFRAIRYWIARKVRGESVIDAGATADLETELWLAQQECHTPGACSLSVAA